LLQFLAPFFLRATGNNMLNFGYWTDYTKNPIEAQNELCKLVGKFADLHLASEMLLALSPIAFLKHPRPATSNCRAVP
jgi:hypothetical protein